MADRGTGHDSRFIIGSVALAVAALMTIAVIAKVAWEIFQVDTFSPTLLAGLAAGVGAVISVGVLSSRKTTSTA